MKHLHNFDTVAEYEAVKDTLEMPYIVSIDETDGLQYNTEVIRVPQGSEGSGGGESASAIEYLDLSGNSPLRNALIQFCYLIKTDGFKIERPDSSSEAERGIIPVSNLIEIMVDKPYEEYLIILDSIKAVAIDFNIEVIISGTDTIMYIKDVFTGAEELLNAIPRLTKEQFYSLE